MNFILSFATLSEKLTVKIGEWSSFLVLPLIAVIMYDVLTRKFAFVQQAVQRSFLYDYMSPTKLQELEWHIHAAFFLLAFGYGYFKNAHVRVDILRDQMQAKRKAVIELAGLVLLALPYTFLMLLFGWEFVVNSYHQGEGSSALTGVPNRWIIKSTLLIGFAFLLISVLATALRLAVVLAMGTDRSNAILSEMSIISSEPVQKDLTL